MLRGPIGSTPAHLSRRTHHAQARRNTTPERPRARFCATSALMSSRLHRSSLPNSTAPLRPTNHCSRIENRRAPCSFYVAAGASPQGRSRPCSPRERVHRRRPPVYEAIPGRRRLLFRHRQYRVRVVHVPRTMGFWPAGWKDYRVVGGFGHPTPDAMDVIRLWHGVRSMSSHTARGLPLAQGLTVF
jgi:hypothetical protein